MWGRMWPMKDMSHYITDNSYYLDLLIMSNEDNLYLNFYMMNHENKVQMAQNSQLWLPNLLEKMSTSEKNQFMSDSVIGCYASIIIANSSGVMDGYIFHEDAIEQLMKNHKEEVVNVAIKSGIHHGVLNEYDYIEHHSEIVRCEVAKNSSSVDVCSFLLIDPSSMVRDAAMNNECMSGMV